MNRLRKALCLGALLAAGCAPELHERCSTAADCPSRQCVAGRCLNPVDPTPAPDAGVDAAATDAEPHDARPAPADAVVPPVPDGFVPPPPAPDAFVPPPPAPDVFVPVPPVPDADVPPPPLPDAEIPPPPVPDAFVPVPPDAAPPPVPDAFDPPQPDASVPLVPELCDGLDQDGDGTIDEGFLRLGQPCVAGSGGCAVRGLEVCTPDGLDTVCDAVAGVPAPEVCNGLDDDCDGEIDEGVTRLFARDRDLDGFGDPLRTEPACEAPEGFVEDQSDCNDRDPAVHPGVKERCNGADDDCDGTVDLDSAGALLDCGVPHGESRCVQGTCGPPLCAPGWHDFDAVADNGCERGCDDGGEGTPVGGNGDGLTEPPAVAGDLPALLWADAQQLPEGRLHFVAGAVSSLVGRADATYTSPSLSAGPRGGFVAAAVRTIRNPNGNAPGPAEGVLLGIDANGATTFELVVSNSNGATAVATTVTEQGRPVAVVAVAPAAAVPTLDLVCVDIAGGIAGAMRTIALPATTAPARPIIRDADGRFALALPNGNGALLMPIESDCNVTALAAAPFEHAVASTGLGVGLASDGRRIAVVSGVNGSDQTIVAFDLSDPTNPIGLPGSTEHMQRRTGYGCPASVVPTAGGFWVYSCEEQPGARGFGLPLDFEGRRVGDAQFVLRPPINGGAIDFMRVAAAPGGAAAAWMLTPGAGARGPIRQARLTCE